MEKAPKSKLELTSILLNKYIACRKLGEGGCGVIYEVALLACPQKRYACKAETVGTNRDDEILKQEEKVMLKMNENNAIHTVQRFESGLIDNYNYLIMTLLGPSLSDLRKDVKDQKFSPFTTTVIAIQALDGLEELHGCGYVHRDVKPSNYAIGELGTSRERVVHILDFGLARAYRIKGEDGKMKLRDPRRTAPFRGTVRYCSLNAHGREEQGRHDDLWSMLYMLIEMYLGDLPWRNMDRDATVREKSSSEPTLLAKCPKEFDLFLMHVKALSYATGPDYKLLRKCFCQIFLKNNFTYEMELDWEKEGRKENIIMIRQSVPITTPPTNDTITLKNLLRIPSQIEEITEEMMSRSMEREQCVTNSSHDDTVECKSPDKENWKLAKTTPSVTPASKNSTASRTSQQYYKGPRRIRTPQYPRRSRDTQSSTKVKKKGGRSGKQKATAAAK